MKRLIKCKTELIKLNKAKSIKHRNILIDKSKKFVIDAISEISLNCLKGNIPLSQCQYKNLKQYRNILKVLSRKNVNLKKKKKIIAQNGGFWTYLIPPALSLLSSLASQTISKLVNKKNE